MHIKNEENYHLSLKFSINYNLSANSDGRSLKESARYTIFNMN